MSGHPASAVAMRHQHILSIFTLMGSFCTCLCILDLFLAPAVMDFPFACFVRWCTIEGSGTSRLLHLLSLPVAQRSPKCHCRQAMFLHIVGANLTLISHCSGNAEGEVFTACRQCRHPPPCALIFGSPFFLFLLFLYHFAYSSSVGKLSFQSLPQQEGRAGGGWGGL